ncbi:type VII secretion target [Mycolicibacterium neworleansense]|uniref:ESX-1 secretion-associated protein n=1 Tax=Mycolicibacterium neworleansense TaxID=146018 RepID=A0A0H5RSL7_9MYCO|nr:type VII secretion target [Mycolicibacterium neworleansense]MCV7361570.1 hypothetical protein [Mycolicibacterium neworleansense]CRZ16923.1 hypothetical protein BN2156_03802 [Mycolicibacterium neworleansense]
MGSELKVTPAGLRAAAAGETAVSQAIAGLGVGEVLGTAASAMPGLQSGAACGQVSSVVDGAVQAVSSEVGAHAGKLTDAASAYQRTDDEYAHRLNSAKPAG